MADKKFLDEDGVSQFAEETKKYIDKHINNADIHVTADDKANWNGKQDALTAEQLAAVNSGINATAKGNYDAHVANADIHVTAADKTRWNGKQDALTSQQIDNINDVVNKANDADVVHKTGDESIDGIKTFSDGIVSNLINGKTPELIEEQGNDYIRYSNGLQMCYMRDMYNPEDGTKQMTYPKSFIGNPRVIISGQSPSLYFIGWDSTSCLVTATSTTHFSLFAIGKWK